MNKSLNHIKDNYKYMLDNPINTSINRFGYQCDEGWHPHINDLVDDIAAIDKDETVNILQIKEKFGSLRFYYTCKNDRVKDVVDILIYNYSVKLSNVCESCGKPGKKITIKNRKKTLCDKCK